MRTDPTLRTELPDPTGSRAVLIGVSDYRRLDPLPAVANNLAGLRELLCEPELWGLDDRHVTVLSNSSLVDEVLDAIHAAATEATEALVVYFAGHGLVDERSDLYLALSDADSQRLHRAVRYDEVRREVVSTARRCRGKVIILDCCYSGRAMLGGMSGAVEVADQARIDGTYLMTASAETKLALAPPGERYTAFSGALIRVLAEGLPDGPDLLGMEQVYWHVRTELEAKRCPVPQQRARNDGKNIAIARNRRANKPVTGQRRHTAVRRPPIPDGHAMTVALPPAALAHELASLRSDGQSTIADQILTAAATHRPDQEVAAVTGQLRRTQQHRDADLVIRQAATRPAVEVKAVLDALQEIGQTVEVGSLLVAAAAAPSEEFAALIELLDTAGHAEHVDILVNAVLVNSPATSRIISLVAALWMAGQAGVAQAILDGVAAHHSGDETIALADALRDAGRQEAAFHLYASGAATVARRPPDIVAQLSKSMRHTGYESEANRLVDAAVAARRDAVAISSLIEAFRAVDQQVSIDRALTGAAEILSARDILDLSAGLRTVGQPDEALQLCLISAERRHAGSIVEIFQGLEDAGRPIDAARILTSAGQRNDAAELVQLVVILRDRGYDDAANRIVGQLAQRPPVELPQIVNGLTGPDRAQLIDAIATQPPEQLAATLENMRRPSLTGPAVAVLAQATSHLTSVDLRHAWQQLSLDTTNYLLDIASDRLEAPVLAKLLHALASGDDTLSTLQDALQKLRNEQSPRRLAAWLRALHRSGHQDDASRLAANAVTIQPDHLTDAIADLVGSGDHDEATLLIRAAVDHAHMAALIKIIEVLDVSGWDDTIEWLFATVLSTRQDNEVRYLIQLLHAQSMSNYADYLNLARRSFQRGQRRRRWRR